MRSDESNIGIVRGALTVMFPLLFLASAACRNTPPPPPDANTVGWTTYTNPLVGYSLEVPDVYHSSARHEGKDVMFRYDGYPVLVVNHLDEAEGKSRGLWPGHEKAGVIELGGRAGNLYVYDHGDGPSIMHTVSYVIPHRGKFLGLEFRTENETPDAIQERILDTLRVE